MSFNTRAIAREKDFTIMVNYLNKVSYEYFINKLANGKIMTL